MIPTLTNTSILYRINRDRHWLELAYERKRTFIGYCIKILLVIAIGIVCWYFKPVPFGNGQGVFLDKGEPKFQTSQGDR